MVKFKFLVQFPVDCLLHQVVSRLFVLNCCIRSLLSLFYFFGDIHISGSWWFSTRVWVIATPQVLRTLLSILADLNNAVVWTVTTRLVISKSSGPCTNPLVTVPRAPITIGNIVTFMFHSFFNFLARSRYLSLFSLSFNFILWSDRTAKFTILQVLSFLLIIRWSVYISKSQRSLCVSFSRKDSGLCIYLLFIWSNFNFLRNSQLITLPT